jgi:hypothetical protein
MIISAGLVAPPHRAGEPVENLREKDIPQAAE